MAHFQVTTENKKQQSLSNTISECYKTGNLPRLPDFIRYTLRVHTTPHETMIAFSSQMFHRMIRIAARSILIQQGPMTGTQLVRTMGLDPKRHKGTVHAVLVDLETQRSIGATRNAKTGKRNLWFAIAPRKRDRLMAAIVG